MHSSEQSFTASAGASSRRAEANRANAQHSTGPKTQAGKARSSQNARKHGLLAQAATLLAEPNQERDALLASYRAELRPTSTQEDLFVRELAVSDWRIKQLDRMELGVLACQMQNTYDTILNLESAQRYASRPMACHKCGADPIIDSAGEAESEPIELSEGDDDLRTVAMGAAWIHNPAPFALLARYQAQARRDYYRALKQLEALRTGKAGYLPEEAPAETSQTIEPEPKPAENETKPTNPTPQAAKAAGAAAATTSTAEKTETNPPKNDRNDKEPEETALAGHGERQAVPPKPGLHRSE